MRDLLATNTLVIRKQRQVMNYGERKIALLTEFKGKGLHSWYLRNYLVCWLVYFVGTSNRSYELTK